MRRDEVLDYERRRELFHLIERSPGLHLRELERRSGFALGTLRHHLRYLIAHGLVDTEPDGAVLRHFAHEFDLDADRRALGALRQIALRRVLVYLLSTPDGASSYADLVAELRVPTSTLALYLQQLTSRGLIERRSHGRTSSYHLIAPERIIRLLHSYRSSFIDGIVDHLLDLIEQDTADERRTP